MKTETSPSRKHEWQLDLSCNLQRTREKPKIWIHKNYREIKISPETVLIHLIIISRYSLWDCRETKLSPSVNGFRFKLQIKYETEKYIATKDNILSGFKNAQNIDKSFPLYFVGLCYNVTMNKNTFSLASLHARARYISL